MFIPTPYFANVPQLGDLALDYIFLEDGYPLLFTCKSGVKLYICICRTVIPKQKWVISEVDVTVLEKMVNREIPICDAFRLSNAQSCIIYWSRELGHEYEVFSTCELRSQDLPSSKMYLDEDDVEDAREYLATIKEENRG